MKFSFDMPVKLVGGRGCLTENANLLPEGKSCIIVTGSTSAKKSGALDDVISILSSRGIKYTVFDEITQNPLLSTCYKGGESARLAGAEFVVGIGGGSPLDAAKAIAAFAANPGIKPMDIYNIASLKPSLPIALVPTTAGTGSEANPYAILTLDGEDKKKTFNSPYSYAKCAFLDPYYTFSLPYGSTLSCALDAFCHCIESYCSPKSTPISRSLAGEAGKMIWGVIKSFPRDVTECDREALLYASSMAGMAIGVTGTGFPHPMGYNLTFFGDIAHGRACGAFIGEYISYNSKNQDGKELLCDFAQKVGADINEIAGKIPSLADVRLTTDEKDIDMFVEKTGGAGNYENSPYEISKDEMKIIYRKLFDEKR